MKKTLATLFCLGLFTPFISHAQTDPVCFCVAEARRHVPATPKLDAKYWHLLPSHFKTVPTIGGIVLLKYETQWDVAVIEGFWLTGFRVAGIDFDTCEPTKRTIAYTDPRIKAFYRF